MCSKAPGVDCIPAKVYTHGGVNWPSGLNTAASFVLRLLP